ncbi:MAG: CDP-diacylglycerol--serine O-phosphatidyltransferase [Bacteroidota bacterium]|nr:MAG: CDP-diacylglycerol--serine O-phosphatidyltransferase [Bacteroidota bacterium]
MSISRYLWPNSITLLNLLCGSLAIITMFEGQLEHPFRPVVLLALAAIFDLADGLVARLLKATSDFGKQLDSLSDLVSFGLAPSIMMYKLLFLSFVDQSESSTFALDQAGIGEILLLGASLSLVLFAALRLARFNITSHSGNFFIGLPVPAAALSVVSVWIEFHQTDNEIMLDLILNPWVLVFILVLLSYLMISKIPMLSLKFKGLGFAENRWSYLLILGSLVFYILFGSSSLIFIMGYYLLLSFIWAFFKTTQ